MYDLKKISGIMELNVDLQAYLAYCFMIVFQKSPFIYLAVIFQMASDCARVNFNSIHINCCNQGQLFSIVQGWSTLENEALTSTGVNYAYYDQWSML